MDVFSHAGYGYAMLRFQGGKLALLAALAGAAPDYLWVFAFKMDQITRKGLGAWHVPRQRGIWEASGPPLPSDLLYAYDRFYGWTHSLVIVAAAALVLYFIGRKRWLWLTLPYGFHVVLDTPTHSRFATPILFPISDWTFNGLSWGDPRIFFPNLVVLALTFVWVWWKYWRRSGG